MVFIPRLPLIAWRDPVKHAREAESIAIKTASRARKWITPLILLALAEVLAGATLRFNVELLVAQPVLLVLIPGLMDLRGDVYGALGYRLSKALHLGLTQPAMFTKFNLVNTSCSYMVSVIATLNLCILGTLLSLVLGSEVLDFASLVFIALTSTVVVFAVLTPLTTWAIIYLFKRGRDPSTFVATIVTGVGDFASPAVLLLVAQLYREFTSALRLLAVSVFALFALAFFVLVLRAGGLKDFLENLASSVVGSTGSSLGGFVLATSTALISKNPEVLAVLPAFNAVIGAATGYLGSSLNISLHVGEESPYKLYRRELVVGLAATYTSVMLALALSTAVFTEPARLLRVVASISASLLVVYAAASMATYYLTVTSFHKGWDPDNVVFPIMTTFVDLLGPVAVSLIGALIL